MKDTTSVFIDGGYLSVISKHFGKGKYLTFDLSQFAITLAKSQELWCESVFYYTAPPYQSIDPTDDGKKVQYKVTKKDDDPDFRKKTSK